MNKKVKRFYDLAYDYYLSSDILLSQIIDFPYLYNPISYLLRHAIELQLKGLIIYEMIKKDKSLKINDARLPISNRLLSQTHSTLVLWDSYITLLQNRNATVNPDFKKVVDKSMNKLDKKDFTSTRYRYPFDKNDKEINIEPIDINSGDVVPDLSIGIPNIIVNTSYNNVKIISKGARLIQETLVLFDVAEILFHLFENTGLIEIEA